MIIRRIDAVVGAILLAAAIPGTASAQASQCVVPTDLPAPHAELPNVREPRRVVPIGAYTLAITWSPQACRTHAKDAGYAFQCGGANRFGFVLHGLWPDGSGKTWPQYCKSVPLLSAPVLRRHLCTTPSVQLLQHEWAKHGSCTGESASRYFDRAGNLYRAIRYPDMDALSRRPGLRAGQFASAFAAANRGISTNMLRISATRDGWLEEVQICMDRNRRYRVCPAGGSGLRATAPLKIWRGGR